MRWLLAILLPVAVSATTLEGLKWYLNPNGQIINIPLDDLFDQEVMANSQLDFGYSELTEFTPNKTVKVAIIDSGLDYGHPDFVGSLLYKDNECLNGTTIPPMESDNDTNGFQNDCLGWSFSDETNDIDDLDGHGTHVAGLIKTFFEYAPENLKILPIKIFGQDNKPLPIKLEKAIRYAIDHNVDLIHLSLGWPDRLMLRSLQAVIDEALAKNIMIVTAAGNSDQEAQVYPCKIKGVQCVGALRADGTKAPFSNYGHNIDFWAAGERIFSTYPRSLTSLEVPLSGYEYKNGTSQAAPLISGALLLMKATLNSPVDILVETLKRSQTKLPSGLMVLNLPRAMRSTTSPQFSFDLKSLPASVKPGEVELKIEVENLTTNNLEINSTLNCSGVEQSQTQILEETLQLTFTPTVSDTETFSCTLIINDQIRDFTLFVINDLPTVRETFEFNRSELPPVGRGGRGRVRFLTIQQTPQHKLTPPEPFYYLKEEKKTNLFYLNTKLGVHESAEECRPLRLWQQEGTLIIEEICEEKFLKYFFYDRNLETIVRPVTFSPQLSIINYLNFELKFTDNGPRIRYLSPGLAPVDVDPWEGPRSQSRAPHMYELVVENNEFKEVVLDNQQSWLSQLGLRVMPRFKLLSFHQGKLLVHYQYRRQWHSVWFDLETQTFSSNNLSNFLIARDQFLPILGTDDDYALSAIITPYEARAMINDRVTLRFSQSNFQDPLVEVLGVEKKENSYDLIIKGFLKLHRLSYDLNGVLTSSKSFALSRFDFLSGQELAALANSYQVDNGLATIIDGTRIQTDFIEIIKEEKKRYGLKGGCVAMTPVSYEDSEFLPLLCNHRQVSFELYPL